MRVREVNVIQVTVKLNAETCINCGVVFGITEELERQRQEDHNWFYCPNGHAQRYTAKTEAERLRDLLREEERRTAHWVGRVDQLRAENAEQAKAIKRQECERKAAERRAHAGVCVWCHRTFVQMARHMQSKHPDKAQA